LQVVSSLVFSDQAVLTH